MAVVSYMSLLMCSPWYIGGFPKIQPKLTLSQKKIMHLSKKCIIFFWESVNFCELQGVDRPKLAACALDGKGEFWNFGRAHARVVHAMRFGKIFLWCASRFR